MTPLNFAALLGFPVQEKAISALGIPKQHHRILKFLAISRRRDAHEVLIGLLFANGQAWFSIE